MKRLLAGAGLMAVLLGSAASAESLKLVEVITSPERTEVLKGMVEAFEAANPGVDVEIVSVPVGPGLRDRRHDDRGRATSPT